MKDYEIIKNCLLCNSDNLKGILDLGETPLANEFVSDPNQEQDTFPLNLIQCQDCNHVQIDCIVSEDRLYKNYYYVTGTSPVNVEHFSKYAQEIMWTFYELIKCSDGNLWVNDQSIKVAKNSVVIEIGSNDGTFLKCFKDRGFDVIGIDPAENIAKIAKEQNGIDTIVKFFNKETALDIKKDLNSSGKKVKAIIANNMFAHNKNLDTIVEGVLELLDDDGSFVFENSYLLDICDKTLVDLIYHEHMHHHHIGALKKFFAKFDMSIYKYDRLPNHGGSIRVYACRSDFIRNKQRSMNVPITNGPLGDEEDVNNKLLQFSNNVQKLKTELTQLLSAFKDQNKSIAIYGTPAKATTLLYGFGINKDIIDFAVDDNSLKQGHFTPGQHIPIYAVDEILNRKPDVILILAWNFAPSIIEKVQKMWFQKFKNVRYPTFITPLPDLKVQRYCEGMSCTCGEGPWEDGPELKWGNITIGNAHCQSCGGIDRGLPYLGDIKELMEKK